MKENALNYLSAGLSVLPANPQLKYAALQQWKAYQDRLPTPTEVHAWFSNGHTGLCFVAGAVSGNLEMIDTAGHASRAARMNTGVVRARPSAGRPHSRKKSSTSGAAMPAPLKPKSPIDPSASMPTWNTTAISAPLRPNWRGKDTVNRHRIPAMWISPESSMSRTTTMTVRRWQMTRGLSRKNFSRYRALSIN